MLKFLTINFRVNLLNPSSYGVRKFVYRYLKRTNVRSKVLEGKSSIGNPLMRNYSKGHLLVTSRMFNHGCGGRRGTFSNRIPNKVALLPFWNCCLPETRHFSFLYDGRCQRNEKVWSHTRILCPTNLIFLYRIWAWKTLYRLNRIFSSFHPTILPNIS